MNRTDRLHAVSEALRRAGARGRTAADLAEELEVSTRTIKRDVSALQQAGAPIWARTGPGGGYVLGEAATLPPVALTPAQALALSIALSTLPPGSPFAVDARTAAAKVLDTMSPDARHRAAVLGGRVWTLGRPLADQPGRPAVVRAVERSLVEQRALVISYTTADGTPSRRVIEPIVVTWTYGRWYVVAWCRLRRAVRWFRVARIDRADLTTEHYQPRPVDEVGEPPEGAAPVG